MALPRTLKELAFGAGINSKGDPRAQDERILDIGVNVEFDEIGNLRCRFPFDSVRTSLVGGGTLSNARKLVVHDNELLCFTKDTLYSWSPELQKWASKGTHLAVAQEETPRFITTGDQTMCDRAELNGTIVYAWVDNHQTYCAAIDKTSGGVLVAPTQVSGNVIRPRLIALTTKILLFSRGDTAGVATGFFVRAIDPADPATGIASAATTILANGVGGYYFDVCKVEGADKAAFVCTRFPPTGAHHEVGLVTAGLAITQSTKAREVTDPVAIACNASGTRLAVIRYTAASVAAGLLGDILNASTLADVTVNKEITNGVTATTVNVTATFHPTQVAGQDVCYCYFGEEDVTTALANGVSVSTIDTAGTTNAGGTILGGPFCLASHSFIRDGHIYFNVGFAGASSFSGGTSTTVAQLQNTIFLFRDDLHLVGKALATVAAGYGTGGHLPGVASTGTDEYSWCAIERRVVPLGDIDGYADRGPRDVVIQFDTNAARRCVRLGQTLYISGAEIRQYDGAGLYEVGFHIFPYYFQGTHAAGGSLSVGGYAYKITLRWQNARGETERSTTATIGTITVAASDKVTLDKISPLTAVTHKGATPAVEVWRTLVNPPPGAPFYLATSNDPTVTSGDNKYLGNSGSPIGPWIDSFSDTTVATKETNPENGAVLESLPPPPATVIAASQGRIFLGGIPDDPNRVWYSRLRGDGEIASFHDSLTFEVPPDGGAITAIDYLDGTLIVWCETATYAFAGSGFDNTGGGGNFQLARTLSKDLGCISSEACAYFDDGFLVKTNKGWYVLDRGLNYQYVGDGPFKYDSESVLATTVLTSRHQIRALTANRMLVFDTLVKQWAEFSISDGVDMLLWSGTPAYLTATGVRAELATWSGYAGTDYTLTLIDIETNWIKFGGMQSRAIIDFVQLLGEYRSSCVIRKRLAKDYEAVSAGVWNYHTDVTWTPTPATVGSKLDVRQAPKYKRCEAIKARFTVTHPDGVSPLGGECAAFTSIVIPFAVEPNAYGGLAAAQKQ